MSAWLQFQAEHPAPEAANPSAAASFFCILAQDGLIAARGPDAATFLHSQLTNDVARLPSSEARLAGLCSAKGRLLATFVMWKSDDGIFLQLPLELEERIRKRLQMFVLRAKVELAEETPRVALLGLYGEDARRFLARRFADLTDCPYGAMHGRNGSAIRLPDASGRPRYLWIAAPDAVIDSWQELASSVAYQNERAWRRLDILAGIPRIVGATQEQFVPQMVNFELIGGVNFKKGCYPGQEIVARSQYLGKLKRRMVLAEVDSTDAMPGAEIFSTADPGQPSGMVVNAEPAGAGISDCLVEIKMAALEAGTVCLGRADGPVLRLRDLPYPLQEPA